MGRYSDCRIYNPVGHHFTRPQRTIIDPQMAQALKGIIGQYVPAAYCAEAPMFVLLITAVPGDMQDPMLVACIATDQKIDSRARRSHIGYEAIGGFLLQLTDTRQELSTKLVNRLPNGVLLRQGATPVILLPKRVGGQRDAEKILQRGMDDVAR